MKQTMPIQDMPKSIKKTMRSLVGLAHEAELRKALDSLRADFDRWKSGKNHLAISPPPSLSAGQFSAPIKIYRRVATPDAPNSPARNREPLTFQLRSFP
jgi:hypothetical protein